MDNLKSCYVVLHCKINTYGIYLLIGLHRFVRGTKKVKAGKRELQEVDNRPQRAGSLDVKYEGEVQRRCGWCKGRSR
jgi:hypothetical protein